MDIKNISKQLAKIGLQERDAQLQMIQDTFNALEQKKIICVEAPTGTGKTISYCLASYHAKKDKQNIVISTATIALQEQLINKDLPLLQRLLGKEVSFAIAKGRRRYVCHARLFSKDWQQEDMLAKQDTVDELQKLLIERQWQGDRDQLSVSVPENEWRAISTDSAGCTGKHCEFYEDCAFYKARKRMLRADMIVTNHSLLLADLELGGGALLPEPSKNIYIIDECHHLPEKALNHFAKSAPIMGSIDWINGLTKAINKGVQQKEIETHQQQQLSEMTHALVQALQQLRHFLDLNERRFVDDVWHITAVMPELAELAQPIANISLQLSSQCELLLATLDMRLSEYENTDKERFSDLSKLVANIGFLLGRSQNLAKTWQLFCHQKEAKEAPIARWFARNHSGEGYLCHTAPINVSQEFKRLFWDRIDNGAVLCSATIRALGSYDDYLRKTGLINDPRLITATVESFFNYSRSILYIPNMQHEPSGSNQQAHRSEVIELLPQLILPKVGTLVLFTSKKAMHETYEQMPDAIAMDILMQGNKSKARLIEQHKDRIRQGRRSVLFGLASFGEGLDLPADFCQHVIIHKLPFAVPTTPIEVTRNDWLKSNNKNAFMMATLPATSIKLTQYVGRLIRHEEDTGIVTILDKRLYSKRYGSELLNNLPQFQRVLNQPAQVLKALPLPETLFE